MGELSFSHGHSVCYRWHLSTGALWRLFIFTSFLSFPHTHSLSPCQYYRSHFCTSHCWVSCDCHHSSIGLMCSLDCPHAHTLLWHGECERSESANDLVKPQGYNHLALTRLQSSSISPSLLSCLAPCMAATNGRAVRRAFGHGFEQLASSFWAEEMYLIGHYPLKCNIMVSERMHTNVFFFCTVPVSPFLTVLALRLVISLSLCMSKWLNDLGWTMTNDNPRWWWYDEI